MQPQDLFIIIVFSNNNDNNQLLFLGIGSKQLLIVDNRVLFPMQDKEAIETAVRAFEDWEFRVLEKESGIDDDDEDEGTAEDMEHGSDMEIEKEIVSQKLLVNTFQVNNIPCTPRVVYILKCHLI